MSITRTKFIWSLVLLIAGLLLSVTLALAVTNAVTIDGIVTTPGDWDDEVCALDEGSQNDFAGAHDMTGMCAATDYATSQPAIALYLRMDWDDVVFTTGATSTACTLMDLDQDSKIDNALCVTLESQAAGSPLGIQSAQLFSCDDNQADRCGAAQALMDVTDCALDGAANTNPWQQNPDAGVECSLPFEKLDLQPSVPLLTGVCSFASGPGNAPSDCVFQGKPASRLAVNPWDGKNYISGPTSVTLVSLSARALENPSPVYILLLVLAGGLGVWVPLRRRFATA